MMLNTLGFDDKEASRRRSLPLGRPTRRAARHCPVLHSPTAQSPLGAIDLASRAERANSLPAHAFPAGVGVPFIVRKNEAGGLGGEQRGWGVAHIHLVLKGAGAGPRVAAIFSPFRN